MMISLDKSSLLIGFYLCLHFHYCLQQEQKSQLNSFNSTTNSSSDSQQALNLSDNNSDSDRGNLIIHKSKDRVYKCLGRLHDTEETTVEVPAPFMSDNVTHIFPLKRKELNCKKGRLKVIFQIDNEDGQNKPVVKLLTMDTKARQTAAIEDSSIKIMRDGAFLHIADDFFHPSEYCFDQTDAKSELSIFVCYPECYGQRPCVTKCCGQDEVWDVGHGKCRKSQVTKRLVTLKRSVAWTPTLFSRSVDNCVKKVTIYHRDQLSVHIQKRLPSCDPSEYKLIPLRKVWNLAFQRFRILWSGAVVVRDKYGNWTDFTPGRYCVDGMVNFRTRHDHTEDDLGEKDYSGAFEDQILIVCPDQMPEVIEKKPIPLRYAVMLIMAASILLLTAVISGLLWDKQNVYEWTVSCEVISMFFLILFVSLAHTVARRPEKSDFGALHCIFIGVASHFFWLATFFWLFIINFEIWWNFRSLVQLRQSRKWCRFGVYQLVGFGCPLLVVVTGLLLDRTWGLQNEDLDCTNIVVPNYGQLNCYISKKAQGPYLFFPIGVILGCNLIFYLLTVCKMWRYQKKSQAIIQYRSRGQTQPILIFAKLFIVMGVSWIFELVSWAITSSEVDKIPLYWVIFDIVTLFQAVSIFIIFIWKQTVLSRLWHKFPSCQRFLTPLTKLPGCVILPNDRDRMASLHQLHSQSPNKIPRDTIIRNHNLQVVAGLVLVPPSSIYNSTSVDGGGGAAAGNGSSSNGNNNINHLQPQSGSGGSAEHIATSSM